MQSKILVVISIRLWVHLFCMDVADVQFLPWLHFHTFQSCQYPKVWERQANTHKISLDTDLILGDSTNTTRRMPTALALSVFHIL